MLTLGYIKFKMKNVESLQSLYSC